MPSTHEQEKNEALIVHTAELVEKEDGAGKVIIYLKDNKILDAEQAKKRIEKDEKGIETIVFADFKITNKEIKIDEDKITDNGKKYYGYIVGELRGVGALATAQKAEKDSEKSYVFSLGANNGIRMKTSYEDIFWSTHIEKPNMIIVR